jgi:hypothetical protein
MARRFQSEFRSGGESYRAQLKTELTRTLRQAEKKVGQAKRPQTIRKWKGKAAAARRQLRKIEARDTFRDSLTTPERREKFNKLSQAKQDLLLVKIAEGISPADPDPFAGLPSRNDMYTLYYANRRGQRLRPMPEAAE